MSEFGLFSGDQEVHELSAPSGKALIYFFSDLAMNLSGFNITYEFEKCPYNCNSRGSCTNSTCVCNEGYTGAYCDTRICTERDEGRPGPCLHGGTCRHSRCSCPPSFHGETCQVETVQSVWDRIPALNAPAGRASHASVMVDDTIWSIEVGGTTKPAPRFDHTIVRYKSKLMMFGGVIERKNITNELWSLDLHKKVWKKESDENNDLMKSEKVKVPPLAVSGHTAHVIGSEMFVFFGYHPEIGFVHNVQIYNFETGKWRFGNTKDQVYGRFRHTSVHFKMDSGDAVLVYGGTMWSNSQNNLTDSLMRYDVKFEKWQMQTFCRTNLPPSGVQLFLHTATILNGLMIVVGGNGYNISESRAKQECFSSELYIIGGFNGKMLNDVWRFSPAECSSATRPEECRSLSDGVKCVFADRACVKFDPFVSYKQSFLSFVKNESPTKLMSECRNTATRQALQVCEEQTDCMSCISEPACGWCPSGDQCLPNDGECVDGQTTWEKCSLSRDPPPPRPCGMANDCRSCKLLPHCNWYTVEGKPACIPLEDESMFLFSRNFFKKTHFYVAFVTVCRCLDQTHLAIRFYCDVKDIKKQAILLRKEQLDRELDRVASSSLPLRLPATPPPIPPGQNLSYCPLACSSLYTCKSSNCSSHKTCAECQLSPECGWLDDGSRTGLGTCTRGSSRGPLEPSPNFHPKQWFFIDCPACQCNGHSMCNETRNTLGGVQEVCGECQDNTMGKHCELCAPGFHGDPRNGGNCTACQCNGQADSCDGVTGYCHCRSKGVSGANELNVDFVFTFKLKNEDKDKHVTDIYLFSIPRKKDTDVTFQISCDGSQANVALNITSSLFESTPRRMMVR
ncbi:unnamed protein product [Nippostrongylus brasiliensis]|uniref:EGF-like domain-containing protein n=1 Tax=Nippostrongylus brasiliensis TaxID=27835 RepID=A0A0N4YR50_NIPBR|nr:unnamed protein product [Nippostrongylus brasiliensis]